MHWRRVSCVIWGVTEEAAKASAEARRLSDAFQARSKGGRERKCRRVGATCCVPPRLRVAPCARHGCDALWAQAANRRPEQIAPIRMFNGASAAGLNFVLRNSAAGRKYQVETLPGGLGVIDFDGDGWPDLFCTNGASLPSLTKTGPDFWNRLYRNNRDGTFSDVTEKAGLQGQGYSMGVAVGDYNNDGHEDLFVVGVHGNHLYRNNGDGTFTDVTRAAGLAGPGSLGKPRMVGGRVLDRLRQRRPASICSSPITATGSRAPIPSAVDCRPKRAPTAIPIDIAPNRCSSTTTTATAHSPRSRTSRGCPMCWAREWDWRSPTLPVTGSLASSLPTIMRATCCYAIAARDSRRSGIDAGVAYNGDGRNISGMGADFGDIDGDGRPDIVMTGLKNETYEVFLNQGHGTFDDGSARTGLLNLSRKWNGWGCGLVDLDNDGWLDLFVAGGGLDTQDAQSNRIFRNRAGHFEDVTDGVGSEFLQPALHRGVVFADFDRDGRIDAAVTALNAPIELWWNRTPRESPARHWLQLRLTGRKSNRSAIGAEVRCRAGGRTQVRTVSGSVGYASTSDLTVHFGLGEMPRGR